MTIISQGRDYFIYLVNANSSTDVPFNITTGYTPTNPPSGYIPPQTMNASQIILHSRSAIDLQVRKFANDVNFFTIPFSTAGTIFKMDINPSNTQNFMWLRTASSTSIIEVMILVE